ncbi:MAG TPA: aldo/keto reductase [Lentisphaeria bacterium]|nr:aldo/keto reductase [Lentisphaeria bacterium]HCG50632.1 aldo/keto reductase [Lentisphaeria bacterium]
MKNKTLKCGFSMPVLGMGTWQMGGRMERDSRNDDAGQIQALKTGLDLGFNLIDTAESYADGKAEELVGEAIRGYDRGKLFLTSKVWKTHVAYDDVLRAAENSLKRLGTDYLDLYLYHQVNNEVPLKETMRAFDRLVSEKLVRHIGVSNFALERFKRAQACAEHKIVVNQIHYSLSVREPESELLPWLQENDVMIQAWRPLRGVPDCALLNELCTKYGKTKSQIALNWLIMQKNIVTITASSSARHIQDNLDAAAFEMAPSDVELLMRDFPEKKFISDAVPLS